MRLYILLGILAVGLAALILNHDSGRTMGMDNNDFGRLVTLSAIATMMAAGALAGRRQIGDSLRQAGIWLLIILVLVTGYLYRFDLQEIGNRLTAGLIPGRAVVTTNAGGEQILVLGLHRGLEADPDESGQVEGPGADGSRRRGCGACRGAGPESRAMGTQRRAMLVAVPVSSRKTNRAGSMKRCQTGQRRRLAATSGRSRRAA